MKAHNNTIGIIDNNSMFIFYKEVMTQAKQNNIDIVFITFSKKKYTYFLENNLKVIYLKDLKYSSDKNVNLISELENSFPDFTLNQCIETDRILKDIPLKEAIKILENYLENFNQLLKKENFSMILGEVTWGVEYLFYHFALYKEIPYINPLNTFASSEIRLVFFDKYNSNNYFLNQNQTNGLKLEKIIENRKNIDINQLLGKKLSQISLNKYSNKLKFYFLYKDRYDYRDKIIMKFKRIQIITRKSLVKIMNKFIYRTLNKNDKFYYYPLHVQPEATPDIVAINYHNQSEIISQVARSLPFGTKLVVKEHPNAIGNEAISKLLWIRKQNNVILISPTTASKQLIKDSLGIITIAGTVGIEARLENKPVILFSNIYYSSLLDHIYKVTNFNKLSSLLKSFLLHEGQFKCQKGEAFLQYMYQNSSNCYIYDPLVDSEVMNPNNINNFLNAIVSYNEKIKDNLNEK